ncbi:hypothetical protein PR202_ga12679 [Eleusine coracana subsp. coracana]|uniref:Uncharacterized protein n=1 Tax=Eleusine coracana subsp. coracana TaxID=191504 RepID=A0AAV5CCT0_ELECO|nr:hypothetical protein QOZ80_3AG0225670 [Eleusine coracana subsp. coracana]GJM95893.1 hypothetical protein PR202_ga12679 [Eleusine coracana subsp. coracana]
MSQSSSPQQVPLKPNPVGVWFCQISSCMQNRWPSSGAEAPGAKGGADGEEQLRVRRSSTTCRSTVMTENTVYLLLDRFAPS